MEVTLNQKKHTLTTYTFRQMVPGDVFVQEGGADYAVLVKISDKQAVSLCVDEDTGMFVDLDEDDRVYSVTNLDISYELEME